MSRYDTLPLASAEPAEGSDRPARPDVVMVTDSFVELGYVRRLRTDGYNAVEYDCSQTPIDTLGALAASIVELNPVVAVVVASPEAQSELVSGLNGLGLVVISLTGELPESSGRTRYYRDLGTGALSEIVRQLIDADHQE